MAGVQSVSGRSLVDRLSRSLLFGAMCWVSLAAGAFAQEGTLLVANRTGGSISFIDFPTKIEVARLPIGPTIPHEVAVSPDGRLALTAEYGPESRHGQHVVLINIPEARIVGRLDLAPKSRPHSVVFHPDGLHALVTMQSSDRIAVIDVRAMKVVRTLPTGGREGHMVRLSPDGSRAYVTSRGAEGTLSVIFLDEERPPVVIRTGRGAEGIAVTPDGREIWVANRHEETISVVDATSLTVVAMLPSRPAAGRIEIGANGLAIVPNGGAGQIVPQYLGLFDVKARKRLSEVPLSDGTPKDGNFGVLIRGDAAFVSDPDISSTIRAFDLRTFGKGAPEVLATTPTPDGLAWSPVRVAVMR
jgi:YVTN family beta-propeller protein